MIRCFSLLNTLLFFLERVFGILELLIFPLAIMINFPYLFALLILAPLFLGLLEKKGFYYKKPSTQFLIHFYLKMLNGLGNKIKDLNLFLINLLLY
jgi:hypothetical protein